VVNYDISLFFDVDLENNEIAGIKEKSYFIY
jgi:hypothetical protein